MGVVVVVVGVLAGCSPLTRLPTHKYARSGWVHIDLPGFDFIPKNITIRCHAVVNIYLKSLTSGPLTQWKSILMCAHPLLSNCELTTREW